MQDCKKGLKLLCSLPEYVNALLSILIPFQTKSCLFPVYKNSDLRETFLAAPCLIDFGKHVFHALSVIGFYASHNSQRSQTYHYRWAEHFLLQISVMGFNIAI